MVRPSPTSDPARPTSALLRLPPELRNTIYNLVLDSSRKIVFDHGRLVTPHSALAATCRQIQAEYLPMLREQVRLTDTVEARIEGLEFDVLISLISKLPPPPKDTKSVLEVTLHFIKPIGSVKLDCLKHWMDALATGPLQDYNYEGEYKVEYSGDCWTVSEVHAIYDVVRADHYSGRKKYRFQRWREECGSDSDHPGRWDRQAIGAAAGDALRQRLKNGSDRVLAGALGKEAAEGEEGQDVEESGVGYEVLVRGVGIHVAVMAVIAGVAVLCCSSDGIEPYPTGHAEGALPEERLTTDPSEVVARFWKIFWISGDGLGVDMVVC